ncbi:hypothetical protein SS1G_06485 [Sclerotinia sclerotiorum 1980 UF-70]|uniref:ABC transporter domain-containing protein n=1 Tax=Sclerotinia sclerotiorum (strain ATCC 18683 / 1980 / Ss-1) TaxID=665079 RepID=A7EMD7_SCLS1|nr:hypothetical protein SS1G_06485 [Sclerotinia sclerotiorum 1980 UF-70]EDO04003.1 hypothetical protein SS1G_06485 [Sclerotinia sclerotiorum 1980 UF-70]
MHEWQCTIQGQRDLILIRDLPIFAVKAADNNIGALSHKEMVTTSDTVELSVHPSLYSMHLNPSNIMETMLTPVAPPNLWFALKILRYAYPTLVFFYFFIALGRTVCYMQTEKSRNQDQYVRRGLILCLIAGLTGTYAVEIIVAIIKSSVEGWNPGQDRVVYLISSLLVFMVEIIALADTKFPEWYPYYGTWFIGLFVELCLIIFPNVFTPPTNSAFDYIFLTVQVIRIFNLTALPIIYFYLRNSDKTQDGADAERQSLLKKPSVPSSSGSSTLNGNGYGTTDQTTDQGSQSAEDDSDTASVASEDSYLERQRKSKEAVAKRLEQDGNWWTYLKGFSVIPMVIDLVIAFIYFGAFGPYMFLVLVVTFISYMYATVKLISMRANQRRDYITFYRKEWTVGQESLDSWTTANLFNMVPYENKRYSGGPLAFLANAYRTISSSLIDAERLLELFKTEPSIKETPGAKDLEISKCEVEFNDVCFSYDERKPILKNVSFFAPGGKTIAFVGETGGGKSTMLKLMDRFYDVKSGSIKIDGQDIRDITMHSLRSHVGVVPQDPTLFNDTIMNNIRYARLDATEDEVYEACKAAAVHDKILKFADGYNSKVGDRGVKLSGGEKQRVAIARAILKQPTIILLDEATSAIDTETEQKIQEGFKALCKGRTTFIVASKSRSKSPAKKDATIVNDLTEQKKTVDLAKAVRGVKDHNHTQDDREGAEDGTNSNSQSKDETKRREDALKPTPMLLKTNPSKLSATSLKGSKLFLSKSEPKGPQTLAQTKQLLGETPRPIPTHRPVTTPSSATIPPLSASTTPHPATTTPHPTTTHPYSPQRKCVSAQTIDQPCKAQLSASPPRPPILSQPRSLFCTGNLPLPIHGKNVLEHSNPWNEGHPCQSPSTHSVLSHTGFKHEKIHDECKSESGKVESGRIEGNVQEKVDKLDKGLPEGLPTGAMFIQLPKQANVQVKEKQCKSSTAENTAKSTASELTPLLPSKESSVRTSPKSSAYKKETKDFNKGLKKQSAKERRKAASSSQTISEPVEAIAQVLSVQTATAKPGSPIKIQTKEAVREQKKREKEERKSESLRKKEESIKKKAEKKLKRHGIGNVVAAGDEGEVTSYGTATSDFATNSSMNANANANEVEMNSVFTGGTDGIVEAYTDIPAQIQIQNEIEVRDLMIPTAEQVAADSQYPSKNRRMDSKSEPRNTVTFDLDGAHEGSRETQASISLIDRDGGIDASEDSTNTLVRIPQINRGSGVGIGIGIGNGIGNTKPTERKGILKNVAQEKRRVSAPARESIMYDIPKRRERVPTPMAMVGGLIGPGLGGLGGGSAGYGGDGGEGGEGVAGASGFVEFEFVGGDLVCGDLEGLQDLEGLEGGELCGWVLGLGTAAGLRKIYLGWCR